MDPFSGDILGLRPRGYMNIHFNHLASIMAPNERLPYSGSSLRWSIPDRFLSEVYYTIHYRAHQGDMSITNLISLPILYFHWHSIDVVIDKHIAIIGSTYIQKGKSSTAESTTWQGFLLHQNCEPGCWVQLDRSG